MGSLITITTDFGTADGYHAVLEGVIGGINPGARIAAISHDLPPGDIRGGWYLLKTHYRYFPPGTVHLAVVDPGVGTRRKILAVTTTRYAFVAPDNGLLSFLSEREIVSIHSVTNRAYALAGISPVFHGRDIMAPAAAYLSLGIDPACLGRACGKMIELTGTAAVRLRKKLTGRIIWIDRFGNLITNITADLVGKSARVIVGGRDIGAVRTKFSDVDRGRPLAYIGSGNHLEIAVREGSARAYFLPADGRDIEIEVAPV